MVEKIKGKLEWVKNDGTLKLYDIPTIFKPKSGAQAEFARDNEGNPVILTVDKDIYVFIEEYIEESSLSLPIKIFETSDYKSLEIAVNEFGLKNKVVASQFRISSIRGDRLVYIMVVWYDPK